MSPSRFAPHRYQLPGDCRAARQGTPSLPLPFCRATHLNGVGRLRRSSRMQVMRRMLITASQNQWLAQKAPNYRFVRRAVQRFMPGEELSQALEAARSLQETRISPILTYLGE